MTHGDTVGIDRSAWKDDAFFKWLLAARIFRNRVYANWCINY